jgi:hypothetical protein
MFFLKADADVTSLCTLCNLLSKSEVEKYCRSLILRQRDFVSFVVYARFGVFEPYKYACHFRDRQPAHLIPTAEERAAIGTSGVGQPLQDKAKKAIHKMSQMLRDRRHLAVHLLYTPDYAHWSLFYFDQRDVRAIGNHWEHGPHIHFVSSSWISLDAGAVYEQIAHGKCKFPAVHIRYSRPGGGQVNAGHHVSPRASAMVPARE